MKTLSDTGIKNDEMRKEYDFSDSKPNKYASILKHQERLVQIDPDVFKVFNNAEQINKALRALIEVMPKPVKKN
jgi:hypothetical protein